ncbi:MAG: hypothetical protein AABW41_03170 [Nanoarchaeota archaeon]
MYSNNKKGTAESLTGILIAVIVLVVFFIIFPLIKEAGSNTIDKDTCKASVLANSKRLEIAGTEITPGLSDLKCPTARITVKKPDKIQLSLANQMYDCWDKFGQGKIKFLDPESETYCIICSKVSFDDEAKGKQINGFLNYLAENKIMDDRGNPVMGINYTYLRYLTDYETKQDELDKLKSVQGDIIDTNNDYAVMFLYYKQQLEGKPGGIIGGGVRGCIFGAVAGVLVAITIPGAGLPVAAGLAISSCKTFGLIGSAAGFMIGSDHAADWAARVVTVPYKDISKLGCTALE